MTEVAGPITFTTPQRAKTKDRLLTGIFLAYVVLLAIATVGELFEITTIQRVFDVKRLFTQ